MRMEEFFREFSKRIFDGGKNVDNPVYPKCGSKMKFYGHSGRGENYVDFPLGAGFWNCKNCKFQFTEDEVWKYHEEDM